MKAREVAKRIHEEISAGFEKMVLDHPEYEAERRFLTMSELYESDLEAYLVYRAVSASGESYMPQWCHAEMIADQIGASDLGPDQAQAALDRLIDMVITVERGEGTFAIPLVTVYAIWVDEAGRKIYFVIPHGIGGVLVSSVMVYAEAVSSEQG